MFSKTPRQTIFNTVSTTPGPGSYDPKDVKSNASQGHVNFNKQGERFRREDSNLSTCSTSTTGSASSFRRPVGPSRANKLQDRLRTFEQQIRERDQIISRLRMDKNATLTRYQMLVDAYKHLRRVSAQCVPAHKLPKDISQEIMRALQEEKAQSTNDNRPSMSEGDIKETMSTFIVEMEQDEDPRISILEAEKAAIEATLSDCQKRVKELEQEREKLVQQKQETAMEIGHLKGCLRAAEVKDAELRSHLDRANATMDSLSSNSTNKDDRLFAALTELGQAKGQIMALETSLEQQTTRFEEARRADHESLRKLKSELDGKERLVHELKDNLNEQSTKLQEEAVALRLSQDERERLSKELLKMGSELSKIMQENSVLEQKSSIVDAELNDLRAKCKKRKADLCELDEELRTMKANYEKASVELSSKEKELAKLRHDLETQIRVGVECQNDFDRQLRQSQDNFERQLEEAAKNYEAVCSQKSDIEAEWKIAVKNVRVLECQVQERDELLEKRHRAQELIEKELQEKNSSIELLNKQIAEKSQIIEEKLLQLKTNDDESYEQIQELETKCQESMDLANTRLNEIRQLEEELRRVNEYNVKLEDSLKDALKEVAMASDRQRSLEQECSQMKLLHLATTAELEQTKTALEKANEDSSEIHTLREELKVAEEGKQSLSRRIVEFEEETEVWTRIRESWNEKLREAEKTQEDHEEEIRQLKSQVLLLEQQLQLTKESHEESLTELKSLFEAEKQKIEECSSVRLHNLQQKLEREKGEAMKVVHAEIESLKAECLSLSSVKETLAGELNTARIEVASLRQSKTEADFFSRKCRQLEVEGEKLRDSINILKEDITATRQELQNVQQNLDEERKANEVHATFTLAVIKAHGDGGGERVEALQAENDKLRHHLESVTQLLNTLENGIESSEKQKSLYVTSLAETQEQIRRLVGHQNSKQRIQYVGKLQKENRELKEEQTKLRAKIDASTRRMTQLEQQLRRMREHEGRLENVTTVHLQQTHNASTFPKMF